MSAGPNLTPIALVFVGFVGTTAVSLGGAAWLLRGAARHADWAPSLAWSTAALGGGALLLAEVAVRSLLASFGLEGGLKAFQLTAWGYFLRTLLVGPGLLLTAFTRRARQTPKRILALQVVQVVAWLLSCLITLAACALAGA